jgi:hypothetical protein
MFNFTFSGRVPKKTTTTSFLRSGLIPERMELGILLKRDFSEEVTSREVDRVKSEIKKNEIEQKCLPRKLGL